MLSDNMEDDPLFKILSWRDPLKNQQVPTPETFKLREVTSILHDDQD